MKVLETTARTEKLCETKHRRPKVDASLALVTSADQMQDSHRLSLGAYQTPPNKLRQAEHDKLFRLLPSVLLGLLWEMSEELKRSILRRLAASTQATMAPGSDGAS